MFENMGWKDKHNKEDDYMGDPEHKIVVSVDVFVHIFMEICDNTLISFKNMLNFEVKQDVLNRVYEEYFALYLYFLTSILKGVIPEADQKTVIEGIIVRVAQKLEQRKVGMLNLMAVFNKRYGEHASFKYFSFEKKDGVAVEESRKNAVDAFSKEITKMIGKEFLYGPIDLLTTKYIQIFQKKLEEKGISLRLKQAINIKVIS